MFEESAVSDLRKLDEDVSHIAEAVEDTSGDTLKLSHLIHSFTHRLCRTLEESKAACNRAPPEQGDGMFCYHQCLWKVQLLTHSSL